MTSNNVFITGANGYIGNAVAQAFARAGWTTYGLVRSSQSTQKLAMAEIIPLVGSIDSKIDHEHIRQNLPARLDVIVSTTETLKDYRSHYQNIINLFRLLGTSSTAAGMQPLVIFTSGVKDYGMGPHLHGEPGPPPFTEESPLDPPRILAARTECSLQLFNNTDTFQAVLVRPSNLFGRSSSYYQNFFVVARQAAEEGKRLTMEAPPNNAVQGLHVDDCADAYVAIASHPRPDEVCGQVFNISSHRYETVDEIARALVKEYNIPNDPEYVKAENQEKIQWLPLLLNFPQWVDSTKLRRITGWRDRRSLFSEALHVYRIAFEAAEEIGDEGVRKVRALSARATRL